MLDPAPLSPDILLGLARLGRRPGPASERVTRSGGAVTLFSASGETTGSEQDQALSPACHTITPVTLPAAERDAWEERAALFEFEGGWPRPLAESLARRVLALHGAAELDAFDRELMAMERKRAAPMNPAELACGGLPHTVSLAAPGSLSR